MTLELTSFLSKPIRGVVFDGTFEAAVNITLAVKEALGLDKVKDFRIDYNHAYTGEAGKTALSFRIGTATARRSESNFREINLREGDCLVVDGRDYNIIPAVYFGKYFRINESVVQ